MLLHREMELKRAEADLRAVGGDPALADALTNELNALFSCPQVKQPAAGVQVLFNKDKGLPPEQQRPNHRGVRISLWCCGQKVKRCNKKTDGGACPSWADAARMRAACAARSRRIIPRQSALSGPVRLVLPLRTLRRTQQRANASRMIWRLRSLSSAFPAMWGHRAPPARPQPRGNPV